MASGQREALKLFRNIARQHHAQLPPILSSALNQQVKKRFLLSFSEFSKATKPQEKQAVEENFFSTWNSYLNTVREGDTSKDLFQHAKVILDKEGKETLLPSPLAPHLRQAISESSPETQQEIQKIRLEIAQRQSDSLRQAWSEAEPELIKDMSPAQLEQYQAAKLSVLNSKTLKPEELKKSTENLIRSAADLANREQYLKYFLPLFKASPNTTVSQNPLLTPDQLKQSAKKIEELQKLTSQQRKEKLNQYRSPLSPEQKKRSEELYFSNKTPEEKEQIELQLRNLNPEERADAIQSFLTYEYSSLSSRAQIRKKHSESANWTPEQREKHLRDQKIEAIQIAESNAKNRASFLSAIEDLKKIIDPKGEYQAQYDKLSEEEKSELSIRAADVYLPQAWNEFLTKKMTDPDYVRASQSPREFEAWLAHQHDPARFEEEKAKFLKSLSQPSKPAHEAKH